MGTANQLRALAASSLMSVKVASVDLPVADDIKVLGVILDRCLTFDKHVSAEVRSCNYHALSTSSSECRTTLPESFTKCQDDHTHTRC